MKRTGKSTVGNHVKIISQHWLRGGEIGKVIQFEQRGKNNWLIQFESKYPGGGIDGDKLWLDQNEFSVIGDREISEGECGEDEERSVSSSAELANDRYTVSSHNGGSIRSTV